MEVQDSGSSDSTNQSGDYGSLAGIIDSFNEPEFEVAIVHDSPRAMAEVMTLFGTIFEVLHRIPMWRSSWWNLADLHGTSGAENPQMAVGRADLIVVSCSETESPEALINWLNEILLENAADRALVFLDQRSTMNCLAKAFDPRCLQKITESGATIFFKKCNSTPCACSVSV